MIDPTEELEGQVIPRVAHGLPVQCDYSGVEVERGDVVTMYASDRDYTGEERDGQFTVDRMYSYDEIERTNIRYPCSDAVEALFIAFIDDGWAFRNVRLIDKSVSDKGVPWKPKDTWNMITGTEVDEFLNTPGAPDMTVGPEDVYDTMFLLGADVSKIMNDEGELIIDNDQLEDLRSTVQNTLVEQAKEMAEVLNTE